MTDRPRDLCLVVGAPRSGTTWLQRLLATSPQVVSPQESNLFQLYLGPPQQAWQVEADKIEQTLVAVAAGDVARRRVVGLPTLLTEDDLLDAQRLLLDRFLARAAATKTTAELVVEKTPAHSWCVDVVDRVSPSARFVHIVRDPRDVMASLRDAAAGWGRSWGPSDPVARARTWLRAVDGARRAEAFGPDRYHELRYEDLRADPRGTLGRVLAFLGLPDDPGTLVDAEREAGMSDVFAYEPSLRDRMDVLDVREPPGFHSGGRVPLDRASRRAAEIVAGPRARELGYTTGWDDVTGLTLRMWMPRLYSVYGFHGARRRLFWPAVGVPRGR